MCLGNTSTDFTASNMKKKKARLNGYVYDFSVYHKIIDTSNIMDIYKYKYKYISIYINNVWVNHFFD